MYVATCDFIVIIGSALIPADDTYLSTGSTIWLARAYAAAAYFSESCPNVLIHAFVNFNSEDVLLI